MLRITLLALLCCGLTLTAAEPPFSGKARPPRKARLLSGDVLKIAPGESARLEIVREPGAPDAVRFAADELKRYLEAMLGGAIPIVSAPSEGKVSLICGIGALSRAAGIDDSQLCRDAFLIRRIGNRVYLLGRDDAALDMHDAIGYGGAWKRLKEQATIFAAYEFLERFAGIRFYFPGEIGTVIPKGKALEIPEIDLFERPDFEARLVSVFSGVAPDQKQDAAVTAAPFEESRSEFKNYAAFLLRLQTMRVPNCHGLSHLELVKRFGATNPEFFALRADGRRYLAPEMMHTGQLCFSNDGLWREIGLDAEALLRGQSAQSRGLSEDWSPVAHAPGFFGAMPQDGFVFCRCERCRTHFSGGGQAISDFVWGRVIDLAEHLKSKQLDGFVTMMSYTPYQLPPTRPIPDNVLVMVAARGPWETGRASGKASDELIRTWNRKTGRNVWLWNYANKFGSLEMPGIPNMTPHAIGSYYRSLGNDISGSFLESETDNWLYNYLNYYVYGKVHWNTSTDVDALLEEHFRLMFGPAADPMRRLFERWERLWIDRIASRNVETALGPMATPPSTRELWTDIYSETECAGQAALLDRAEQLAASDPDSLKRVQFIRAEFFAPLSAAADNYRRNNDAVGAFEISMPVAAGNAPVTLDGKPDEAAWHAAEPVWLQPFGTGLMQRTSVRLLRDGKTLYAAFDCDEPEMDRVVAVERKPNDPDLWQDNNVELFLNLSGNRKEYWHIAANSKGSSFVRSCRSTGAGHTGEFVAEQPRVAVARRPGGWTIEFAIALDRLAPAAADRIAANFTRTVVKDRMTTYTWSPFLQQGFHEPENFGTIRFGTPELPANLLKDGSFEVAKEGPNLFGAWYSQYVIPAGCAVELDEQTFIHGTRSIRLTRANEGWSVQQPVKGLKPSTRYRLSYFVKLAGVKPSGESGGACGNLFNRRNLWFPENRLTGTTPWFRQSFEFTSAPETDPNQETPLHLSLVDCAGTVWFDAVKLEEIR